MDVILCRNVIIYFDADTKRRVIETFSEKLNEDGHLLLGHSESLVNVSTLFELRHLRHDMVYSKPSARERSWRRWERAVEAAIVAVDGEERCA
jgi:chemotaxis protein methyltransferase CheR